MNEILKANYFGLSNTAINILALPSDIYIPADIIAVDWWIYSIMLLNQKQYTYDNHTITFYRQHGLNTVGLNNFLNKFQLLNGIEIKLLHYKRLLEYCNLKQIKNIISQINNLIIEFQNLKISIKR